MSGSNSDAIKARISELRRQRRAQLGIVERAENTIFELRAKASRARTTAAALAAEIRDLGGIVRS